MDHTFDKDYWEQHWQQAQGGAPGTMSGKSPNPYVATEVGNLIPGTALDAGCGAGAEAIWLALTGWEVTAADISSVVLTAAAERATASGVDERISLVEADLSTWTPDRQFDLVMTHYAHPAMPQLDFYDRISEWVAPGGTLLLVGHRQQAEQDHGHGPGHGPGERHGHGPGERHGHGPGEGHGEQDGPGVGGEHPPAEASSTAAAITARLDESQWKIVTADEHQRTVTGSEGRAATLHDVVVRATRLPQESLTSHSFDQNRGVSNSE